MIDVETLVFSRVKKAVSAAYPKAFTESSYVEKASQFPCVSLVEADNAVYRRSQDLSGREHHASVVYECNIYTTGNGKKQQAKAIAAIVDAAMSDMGFTRTLQSQIPNLERTIYRFTLRYTAAVSEGKPMGDDTVFMIFRQ